MYLPQHLRLLRELNDALSAADAAALAPSDEKLLAQAFEYLEFDLDYSEIPADQQREYAREVERLGVFVKTTGATSY